MCTYSTTTTSGLPRSIPLSRSGASSGNGRSGVAGIWAKRRGEASTSANMPSMHDARYLTPAAKLKASRCIELVYRNPHQRCCAAVARSLAGATYQVPPSIFCYLPGPWLSPEPVRQCCPLLFFACLLSAFPGPFNFQNSFSLQSSHLDSCAHSTALHSVQAVSLPIFPFVLPRDCLLPPLVASRDSSICLSSDRVLSST
jgi:hypothetical protein